MQPLLTASQMRKADREAIEGFGIPELVLMEHAALGLVEALENRFGQLLPRTRGLVIAGPGNNGGDVLAAARLLHEKGCSNQFVILLDAGAPSPSSAQQLRILGRLGIAWGRELTSDLLEASDWVLDGLLGTGLSRDVEGPMREWIRRINETASRKWIVSADIPSGLCADTGNARGEAIRASETVAFGFYKRGQVTGAAADYVGKLGLRPIGIPRTVSSAEWTSFLYDEVDARRLPPRREAGHKGAYGHVAVVAGPEEKLGAAGLSALGALRAGCGLTTVLAESGALEALRPRLPLEIMTETLDDQTFPSSKFSVAVIGPGLGTEAKAASLLVRALKFEGPLIIDADAINLLAASADKLIKAVGSRSLTVLTPHPKEAARLLDTTVEEIQRDRYAAVEKLANLWQCVIVLKGKGTLVASPQMPTVAVTSGDSGLSKGGTGDVLSGIVASFLAQGLRAPQAVPLAVFLHGKASERITERRGNARSTLASEVADELTTLLGGMG